MKPPLLHNSSPHLPVKSLRETLDYYRDVLGFSEEWTFGPIDGGIKRGNLRLLFAEDAAFVSAINNSKHRLPIMWFVDNIQAFHQEFQERGIKLEDELKLHSYGLWEFAFIDINGYYIRVAESAS